MNKLKRIVCILLTLCFTVALTSCGEKPPQEVTSSGTTENAENEKISLLCPLTRQSLYLSDDENNRPVGYSVAENGLPQIVG